MSANNIQVKVEAIRRDHFSRSKTRDNIMGRCDALETKIIRGGFPASEIEQAVDSKHLIRGNLQSIYVRVEQSA